MDNFLIYFDYFLILNFFLKDVYLFLWIRVFKMVVSNDVFYKFYVLFILNKDWMLVRIFWITNYRKFNLYGLNKRRLLCYVVIRMEWSSFEVGNLDV